MARTIPSILDRLSTRINMTIPKRYEGVSRYRVSAQRTLDDAYGATNGVAGAGVVDLFTVAAGGFYATRELRRQGAIFQDGSNYKNVTHAVFDLDEFLTTGAAAGIPSNSDTAFFRLSEQHPATGVYTLLDAIVVVPPYPFMNTSRPVMTLAGTTPAIAGVVAGGYPPPGSMNFHLPLHSSTVQIFNHGVSPILYSFAPGVPMSEIPVGGDISITGGMVPEVFMVSVANIAFSANFTIANSA